MLGVGLGGGPFDKLRTGWWAVGGGWWVLEFVIFIGTIWINLYICSFRINCKPFRSYPYAE
jgi:hypothetical protein